MDPKNYVLDGVHTGATWRIQLIYRFGGDDAVCRYHYYGNVLFSC